MPLYHYTGFSSKGKRTKGMIEGLSEKHAKTVLRESDIIVTAIKEKKSTSRKENLRGDQLVVFTVQLEQMIGAGIPIYESLVALEEHYREESFHRVLQSLCEKIKSGFKLSEAMASFPGTFNTLYCSMIKAGESAGNLDEVLNRLSALLKRQSKLKKEMTTAMIYPATLAAFACIVIIVLLTFVVPSIAAIFEGRELNTLTSMILTISAFFRSYWWLLSLTLVAIVSLLSFQLSTPKGKVWRQKFILRIPGIRLLTIQSALARFCRTMGTLQEGGVPILESMQTARGVMNNVALEDVIKAAEKGIVSGRPLSKELARSAWIPKLIPRMIGIGEESGTLKTMLNKIADMYEDEVEKSITRLLTFIQPIILIVMGAIIGLVMLAILLPLTDVSSFTI
ncbi:MAG: type II secretion system F family protein [Waddliaceae bacterium]